MQSAVRDGVLATALRLYLSGCSNSSNHAPPEAAAAFRSAEALFAAKSWAAAAELFSDSLRLGHQDLQRCHNLLGVCYYWLGRDAEATSHLLQAQSADIRHDERCDLVRGSSATMVARLRSIVEDWFAQHSTAGQMSREQCAAFVRSCRHDKCQEDDERIVQLYRANDSDGDGFLSLEDFLGIYREKARDKPKGTQVVWQNLTAQGFGPDLRPKLSVQHEPKLLMQIIGGTPDGRPELHCTACDKRVTVLGSLQDKSDQICPHPLFKVAVCGGCFDRYMLSIVEPSSAVAKVTSCLYPDLLGAGSTEGKFPVDDAGREKCCRWCGEERAARVDCDTCDKCICEQCCARNFGSAEVERIKSLDKGSSGSGWSCFWCDGGPLRDHQSWLMRLISCAASEKEEKKKRQNRKKRLRQKEKKRQNDGGEAGSTSARAAGAKGTQGLASELPGNWSVLGPWQVADWSTVSKKKESLSSETYEVGGRKWRIVLSGPSRNETGYIGVFLGCPEAPEVLGSENRARFILSIINQATADNYDSQEYEHAFDETQDWGLTKFLETTTLENPANGFIRDDSVMVAVYVQNLPDETPAARTISLRVKRTDLEDDEEEEEKKYTIRGDAKLQLLMQRFAKEEEGNAAPDIYKFTAKGRGLHLINTADELQLEDNEVISVRLNSWKLEKEKERARRKQEKAAEEERKKRRKENAIMAKLKKSSSEGSRKQVSSPPKETKAKTKGKSSAKSEAKSVGSPEKAERTGDPVVVVEVQVSTKHLLRPFSSLCSDCAVCRTSKAAARSSRSGGRSRSREWSTTLRIMRSSRTRHSRRTRSTARSSTSHQPRRISRWAKGT